MVNIVRNMISSPILLQDNKFGDFVGGEQKLKVLGFATRNFKHNRYDPNISSNHSEVIEQNFR